MPDKFKPRTLPSYPPSTHDQNLCISILHVLPLNQQGTPRSQSTWSPSLAVLSHQYGSTRGSLPFSLSFCHSAHTPTSQPHGNIGHPVCLSAHGLVSTATNLSWRDSSSLQKGLAIMKSQRTNPLSFGNTASCQEHCCHCHCVGVGIPSIYTLGWNYRNFHCPSSFLVSERHT